MMSAGHPYFLMQVASRPSKKPAQEVEGGLGARDPSDPRAQQEGQWPQRGDGPGPPVEEMRDR
jgi:hypothetical protein